MWAKTVLRISHMYSGSPSTKSAIGIDGYALARSKHDATMHATTTEMPRRRSVAPMKPPQYEKSRRYMSSSRLKPPSVTAYAIERCHVFCSSGPHCRRAGGERGREGLAGAGGAAAHVGAVGADRALEYCDDGPPSSQRELFACSVQLSLQISSGLSRLASLHAQSGRRSASSLRLTCRQFITYAP